MKKRSISFQLVRKRKNISYLQYVKSRMVTPAAIIKAAKDPIAGNRCFGNILFTAIYMSGKAIEGYDFL